MTDGKRLNENWVPCEQPITADKRKIRDFPKLPSATSFIRKPLNEICE